MAQRRRATPPQKNGAQVKTIKVRIAVLVDQEGHWTSAGAHNWAGQDAMGGAYECLDPIGGVQEYWLTAELPIPETLEVQATAEKSQ